MLTTSTKILYLFVLIITKFGLSTFFLNAFASNPYSGSLRNELEKKIDGTKYGTDTSTSEITEETNSSSVILSPVADSFVRGGSHSNTNYGTLSYITIKTGLSDGWSRNGYLKFNLNNISSVSSAKLRLYASNIQNTSTPVTISVYVADSDDWTENGITWTNAPVFNTTASATLKVGSSLKYYEFDVTQLVEKEVFKDKVITFVVKEPDTKDLYVDFHSKESSSNKPELVIIPIDIGTAPSAPANFKAVASGSSSIKLSWTAVTGADSYSITYAKGSSTTYNQISATLGGSATSYEHSGLEAGTTYTYRIKAVNGYGSSAYSSSSATTTSQTSTSVTLTPTADSFTRGGSYADNNYGTSNNLTIKTGQTDTWSRNAYLKFNLSNISSVSSAKLRLYAYKLQDTSTPVTVSIYGSNSDSWTETGITWRNAPAVSTEVPAKIKVGPAIQYYDFDVTHLVQKELSGDKIVSFIVKDPEAKDLLVDFYSKENSTSKPVLVITSGSDGTTTSGLPIAKKSIWKYNDQGVYPGSSWTSVSFDDSAWKSGAGVLGYGDPVSTTLNFGPSSTNKFISYYFRHKFNVSDASIYQNLIFNIRRDDGAVVYLNGVELFRTNMPSGTISNQTVANSTVGGEYEFNYYQFKVPSSQLKTGVNVVSVSVHQDKASSSDMTFDMEVKGELKATAFNPCSPESAGKIGCFTSIKPAAQNELFVLPETHTFQQIAKSNFTKYTSGATGTLPSGNDFTAFIPKLGSSSEGLISLNHENHPGGVSILDVKFNDQTKLWEVGRVHKMNFAAIEGTSRNCSGGITPWGTVITSEESYERGDLNGDGYQDYGWNVEFDPLSGKLKDYDADGKPDKLWAMGRMKHENVAIGKDGITVFQGEDGGTSCVYKFVANKSGDLSSGTLYVLKRNNSNPSLGDWIKVPNTTKSDRNNTSSIAASLGGTDWGYVEDVEWGPDGKIYFASKITGTIWRFTDNGSGVSNIEEWVTNRQYPIVHSSGTQMENFGVGVDNMAFDGDGNLWALQDGDKHYIWVIGPDHTPSNPNVKLFATIPIGAEPTGLTFTPDFKYGFLSFQHPNTKNTQTQKDASGATITHNASVTLVFARKEHLGGTSATVSSGSLTSTLKKSAPASIDSSPAIKVYPNPFTSAFIISISLEEKSTVEVEIVTPEGKVVKRMITEPLPKGYHSLDIDDIENLPSGVYMLNIFYKNNIFRKRIIHYQEIK